LLVECAKNFRYLSLSSLTPRTMAAASLVVASLGARATPRVVASRRVARASSRARRDHPCFPSSNFRIMFRVLCTNPSAMPQTLYTPPTIAMSVVMK